MQFPRAIAEEQLIPNDANAVDVVPRVRRGTAPLLWGHVERGSRSAQHADGCTDSKIGNDRAADAEVGKLHTIGSKQDVRWFQIAMNDPMPMSKGQTFDDSANPTQCFLRCWKIHSIRNQRCKIASRNPFVDKVGCGMFQVVAVETNNPLRPCGRSRLDQPFEIIALASLRTGTLEESRQNLTASGMYGIPGSIAR